MTRYRVLQTPVFESLVEELMDHAGEGDGNPAMRPSAHAQGAPLWSIDSLATEPVDDTLRSFGYAENAFAPDPAGLPAERPEDAETISKELGLRPGLTADQIAALRRNFAMCNHPDKSPPELRKNATERMMIANALCDRYLLTNS